MAIRSLRNTNNPQGNNKLAKAAFQMAVDGLRIYDLETADLNIHKQRHKVEIFPKSNSGLPKEQICK